MVFRTNVQSATRQIRLTLESGGTATVSFTQTLPSDWLQFSGPGTTTPMSSSSAIAPER